MQEFVINGRKHLCFLVKKGTTNDIVIRYDQLAPIDLRRITELEKQGGELMRVMRDTTLDNGVNALKLYEHLLIVVPKEVKKEESKKEETQTQTQNTQEASKRRRGRPKKSG